MSAFSNSNKDITLRVSLVRGVYEIGRHGSPTPALLMNIYCSRDPIVHFLPYPRVYSAATVRSYVAAFVLFCRFSPPYKEWLDNKKAAERGSNSRIAEVWWSR